MIGEIKMRIGSLITSMFGLLNSYQYHVGWKQKYVLLIVIDDSFAQNLSGRSNWPVDIM